MIVWALTIQHSGTVPGKNPVVFPSDSSFPGSEDLWFRQTGLWRLRIFRGCRQRLNGKKS